MTQHLIFENYDTYSDDNRQCAIENIIENEFFDQDVVELKDNYGKLVKVTREEYKAHISQERIDDECSFMESINFDDEHAMLKRLDQECNGIIAIANLGLWDGRHIGYKEYSNLGDIMYTDCDYERIYVDGHYNLRKEESHHDGNNSILYRQWKDNITDTQRDNFLDKCYNGTLKPGDISRYTMRIGHLIAREYGF